MRLDGWRALWLLSALTTRGAARAAWRWQRRFLVLSLLMFAGAIASVVALQEDLVPRLHLAALALLPLAFACVAIALGAGAFSVSTPVVHAVLSGPIAPAAFKAWELARGGFAVLAALGTCALVGARFDARALLPATALACLVVSVTGRADLWLVARPASHRPVLAATAYALALASAGLLAPSLADDAGAVIASLLQVASAGACVATTLVVALAAWSTRAVLIDTTDLRDVLPRRVAMHDAQALAFAPDAARARIADRSPVAVTTGPGKPVRRRLGDIPSWGGIGPHVTVALLPIGGTAIGGVALALTVAALTAVIAFAPHPMVIVAVAGLPLAFAGAVAMRPSAPLVAWSRTWPQPPMTRIVARVAARAAVTAPLHVLLVVVALVCCTRLGPTVLALAALGVVGQHVSLLAWSDAVTLRSPAPDPLASAMGGSAVAVAPAMPAVMAWWVGGPVGAALAFALCSWALAVVGLTRAVRHAARLE